MRTKGIIMPVMKFPMKVIIKSIIGCSKFADTILPVVIISVIIIGIKEFIKPTKLCIESFTISRICTKFVIINATIKMYCT